MTASWFYTGLFSYTLLSNRQGEHPGAIKVAKVWLGHNEWCFQCASRKGTMTYGTRKTLAASIRKADKLAAKIDYTVVGDFVFPT